QTRSMKPPPRCKTCRTVDEKAASPTRGKCLSPASRSSLFTASDKRRLRSPVSCILRSNGLNHHECAKGSFARRRLRPFRASRKYPKKGPFSNMIKRIIAFEKRGGRGCPLVWTALLQSFHQKTPDLDATSDDSVLGMRIEKLSWYWRFLLMIVLVRQLNSRESGLSTI